MDDTISRQAAIRIASGYCHPANIAKELAKLPSAQPEPQWIPCSEGLPEMDGEYLCDYSGHIHIGQVINGHFRHYGEIADHLISAWMPLPEPYAERRQE